MRRRRLLDDSQLDEAVAYCDLWSRVLVAWDANHSLVERPVDSYGDAVTQLAELKNYASRAMKVELQQTTMVTVRQARLGLDRLLSRCFAQDESASVSTTAPDAPEGGAGDGRDVCMEQYRPRHDRMLVLALEHQRDKNRAATTKPSPAGQRVLTLLSDWRSVVETRTLMMEVLRGERDESIDVNAVSFLELCDALKQLDLAVAGYASLDGGVKALRRVAHPWDRFLLQQQLAAACEVIEHLERLGAYGHSDSAAESLVQMWSVRELAHLVSRRPRAVMEALLSPVVRKDLFRKDRNGKRKGSAKRAAEVALSVMAPGKWAKVPKRAADTDDPYYDDLHLCYSALALAELFRAAVKHDRLGDIPIRLYGTAMRLLNVRASRPTPPSETSPPADTGDWPAGELKWSCLDDWLLYNRPRVPKLESEQPKAIRYMALEFLAPLRRTSVEQLDEGLKRAKASGCAAEATSGFRSELEGPDVDALLGLREPTPDRGPGSWR